MRRALTLTLAAASIAMAVPAQATDLDGRPTGHPFYGVEVQEDEAGWDCRHQGNDQCGSALQVRKLERCDRMYHRLWSRWYRNSDRAETLWAGCAARAA